MDRRPRPRQNADKEPSMNENSEAVKPKFDFWYAIEYETGISQMIFANFHKAMEFLSENENDFYLQRVTR